ncbi:uncharacterized protein FFFS_15901 [Fusarium fujikuroi]|nr:uncharacterized protein FFFS_15901 [Fusarium fujikuroi]
MDGVIYYDVGVDSDNLAAAKTLFNAICCIALATLGAVKWMNDGWEDRWKSDDRKTFRHKELKLARIISVDWYFLLCWLNMSH